jgi:hypothetical protein
MMAMLANWRLIVIGALLAVPSIYATVLKFQRDAARETVQQMIVEARLQEERTKAEIARQKDITKGITDEHKKRINRLNADAVRLRGELLEHARREFVSAVPDPAGSGDEPVACFDRGALNAELGGVFQRFAARLTGIAGEGESVSAAFAACSEWAVKEAAKRAQ